MEKIGILKHREILISQVKKKSLVSALRLSSKDCAEKKWFQPKSNSLVAARGLFLGNCFALVCFCFAFELTANSISSLESQLPVLSKEYCKANSPKNQMIPFDRKCTATIELYTTFKFNVLKPGK